MITHLRNYFSVILITLSFAVFAQDLSISGKVIDQNGDAIELANVVVLAEDGSTFFKGTSTDNSGFFKINDLASSTYVVKISYIGFQEFEQKIILTGDLDLKIIQLSDISEYLDEVTVIAKKPTITRKPDRLIFNIENTALTEGSTLGVLKSTPGVIVSDGNINIKSSPATVFINDRRVQLNSDELIQLLESAPANSIKSVEVITNPSASYDADSGSVINIIMSKNLVTGYRGSVTTNYTQGVFPRYYGATSHYFKNNKINLNLNYSYTQQKINRDNDDRVNYLDNSNDIDEIWSSDINRNTYSQSHNLNLNFDYYFDDKNVLSLTSTGLYTPYFKYTIKNSTDISDENFNFLSRFTSDNLSRDNKYNIGTDLTFNHNFDNNASLSFNAHYTTYDYKRNQNVISNFYDDNNMFVNDSEFKTIANQNTDIINGKIDYKLPINESTNFDVGVKYSNVNTESDIERLDVINENEVINTNNSDAFKYDEKVFAGYTNFSKSWNKWDLNLGLRAEQTSIEGESLTLNETNTQDYLEWFPNASLSHQLTDDISLYGNYKRSITRPSYTDLNPFTFFLNENTVVVGNSNLVPSFSDYYNIGIGFLEHFNIEAYYVNYDGAIEELPRQNNETNIIAYTPVNMDKTVDYGFDFLFNYYPSNKFGLYAVASFFNFSEEVDFGDGFVELSQWSQLFIINPSLSLLKDNSLNIDMTLLWFGKNLNKLRTVEDRLISTISISKSIFNKKGVISLTAEDLFNQQDYRYSTNYLNQSNSSFLDMDNRTIKLGFRYNFGNTKLNTNERTTDAEERERLKKELN